MKCDAYKDKIFLYEQLDPAERTLVDEHIRSCPGCTKLLKDSREVHSMIHSSITDVAPLNAGRLTDRIMESVSRERSQPSRTFNWWPSLTGWNLMRLSLSCLSILLILSFSSEYTKKGLKRTRTKITVGSRFTVLNSSHFFRKFTPDESGKVGFWEAQRQYRKSKLKEKTSNWSKLKKRYETEK